MPYQNKIVTEVCVETYDVAVAAAKAGVDRIELCSSLISGGLTPAYSLIEKVCNDIKIPVHVMVRPRAGDFLYSDVDFELMLRDVENAKSCGASGIVFGILTADGSIDVIRSKKLIQRAQPMKVTFHRAFDMTSDPFLAIVELINLGVDVLLTSGQRQLAEDGVELIRELVKRADSRISVMAGSGINSENILLLHNAGVCAFHFSASKKVPGKMNFLNHNLSSMGSNNYVGEYDLLVFDKEKVDKIFTSINSLK